MNSEDRVSAVKGIGAKTESHLARIGIYTVGDFIEHYPREYHTYDVPISIDNTEFDNCRQYGYSVVLSEIPKLLKRGRTAIVSVMLHEGTASVQAVWYHSPYIRQQLQPGKRIVLYGKIIRKGSRRIFEHPDIYTEEQYALLQKSLQPVYGLTEGVTQNFFIKTMHQILDSGMLVPDPLPTDIRRAYHLAEYNYALRQIHFPENEENCRLARRRLVFDEFLVFALSVKRLKKENHQIQNHYPIREESAVEDFMASLPYTLTRAQLRVWQEIAGDLKSPVVMNRLVQGDVGSGKTMIAALAMFAAASAGFQSCMMAPTEVLAKQHYENLQALFEPFHITTVLLTGSMTASVKRKVYNKIDSHEADVIIGTQALFQEKAIYDKLALIVTDEQHRFGVRQREQLAMKSQDGEPHVLVMSATPIPRTLAIILYSDLDISVVDEKPANRLPIKNCVVGTGYRPTAYRFLQQQVMSGHQVYVVCPMVEESENIEAENVQDYTEKLRQELPQNIKVEYLHGQMKPDQKNQIMERFSAGEIQILVSTTVIEVGVDVPNATVMMIENAERFGLAQLHQLRGRVGRGDAQSYCIFIYGQDNKKVKERLDIMLKTNDGFKIASEDLKLRGPGDMFGIRQSGSMIFKIGDVFVDSACLVEAGKAADTIFEEDPELESEKYAPLKRRITVNLSENSEQIIL